MLTTETARAFCEKLTELSQTAGIYLTLGCGCCGGSELDEGKGRYFLVGSIEDGYASVSIVKTPVESNG